MSDRTPCHITSDAVFQQISLCRDVLIKLEKEVRCGLDTPYILSAPWHCLREQAFDSMLPCDERKTLYREYV